MVVIIPKGSRYFRVVVLVEVLRKAATVLLKWRLTTDINFHDTLHGLHMGRGMGTTSLEAKMLQHLKAMR